jgi:hypothetical protein
MPKPPLVCLREAYTAPNTRLEDMEGSETRAAGPQLSHIFEIEFERPEAQTELIIVPLAETKMSNAFPSGGRLLPKELPGRNWPLFEQPSRTFTNGTMEAREFHQGELGRYFPARRAVGKTSGALSC